MTKSMRVLNKGAELDVYFNPIACRDCAIFAKGHISAGLPRRPDSLVPVCRYSGTHCAVSCFPKTQYESVGCRSERSEESVGLIDATYPPHRIH